MGIYKIVKWLLVGIIITVLTILYRTYNPIENNYFPKCPFKVVTGLDCPGCGSQRAVHFLLNFDVLGAMRENLMLVLFIPYIFINFIIDILDRPNDKILKLRKFLFGHKAIVVILILIFTFWVFRNIINYC